MSSPATKLAQVKWVPVDAASSPQALQGGHDSIVKGANGYPFGSTLLYDARLSASRRATAALTVDH
jgi:hypothetical protein